MDRLGVIDIGTNSVHLLVGGRKGDEIFFELDALEPTRLGEGLDKGKRLSPEAMERTAEAVVRFASVARSLCASRVIAFGTAALRQVENGSEFIGRLRASFPLEVSVISGEKEAYFTYKAVSSLPIATGRRFLILDLGGGSSEFIFGNGGRLSQLLSIPLGCVGITERFFSHFPISSADLIAAKKEAVRCLSPVSRREKPEIMIGVGGTVTSLAHLALGGGEYDPERVEGFKLKRGEIEGLITKISLMSVGERVRRFNLHPLRADILLGGAVILSAVMDLINQDEIVVSSKGARHGVLIAELEKGG
jgi:exopolyphosphatase/guanosine-5'-triphosphate,3'-diphosphate pyrophosphatase